MFVQQLLNKKGSFIRAMKRLIIYMSYFCSRFYDIFISNLATCFAHWWLGAALSDPNGTGSCQKSEKDSWVDEQ